MTTITPSTCTTPEAARAQIDRLDRQLITILHERHLYAERLADYNCNFASALHNTTSAAQRREAVKKLKGYEDDLRSLIAEAAS